MLPGTYASMSVLTLHAGYCMHAPRHPSYSKWLALGGPVPMTVERIVTPGATWVETSVGHPVVASRA